MTQAELEKEAWSWADKQPSYTIDEKYKLAKGYVAGAAPLKKKLEAVRGVAPAIRLSASRMSHLYDIGKKFGIAHAIAVTLREVETTINAILSAQEPSEGGSR